MTRADFARRDRAVSGCGQCKIHKSVLKMHTFATRPCKRFSSLDLRIDVSIPEKRDRSPARLHSHLLTWRTRAARAHSGLFASMV
jgi:hypothetical protein